MSDAEPTPAVAPRAGIGSERAKAFIDAVVAIALTLLILPLMDAVGDAADGGLGAEGWFAEHWGQLLSFLITFVLIATFWINHHRVFARVERVSSGLLWVTMGWLLTIVWLPVATSMSGQLGDGPGVKATYIGSLFLVSLMLIAIRLYLRAHPELHTIDAGMMRRGLIHELTLAGLFLVAGIIAVAFPALGYWPMLLLTIDGVLGRVLAGRDPAS